MSSNEKPTTKPSNPNFGSGPTTKHAGWSLSSLDTSALGRSHRSALGKKKLAQVDNCFSLIFLFFFLLIVVVVVVLVTDLFYFPNLLSFPHRLSNKPRKS